MDYTIVGVVSNTHGIKGELKIYPLTDDINRFYKLKKAYLGEKKEILYVESVKIHKGLAIIKFKNLDTLNESEKYKGKYIYVDETEKVSLPKDRYFISDLINCTVITISNEIVGKITDVITGNANDVYVVTNDEGKEFLIPAVKKFIINVDIYDKLIIIDPIEGMLE
ncbi:MAG: 16S rRNA processing protein RimM [Tissierellales bacterium]|jgi:16S rRNA processing protein RimM|nr:16S rRNA processing protein RimM [Tissierellales bacterium]